MSENIVRQLRAWAEPIASGFEVPAAAATLHRAADEIERLRASNAELVAALKEMLAKHPVCSRPIGQDGSPARRHQDEQREAVAAARAAIARAGGEG